MKRDRPAYVYAKGRKGYLYFCKGGQSVRIKNALGTPEFAAEYAALLREPEPTPERTIAKLIDKFRHTPKWAKLSANTRRSYSRSFDWFLKKIPDVDPAKIKSSHIVAMQEALSDKPTDANRKIAALSVLLEYGKRNDWVTVNLAYGFEQLESKGRVRGPWPVELIAAYRATATGRALLLFEMLLGTGQRIGDVLAMQWGHCDGDGITVSQQKTGKGLYIPLTDRLRLVLAGTPRKGLYIVSQDNGLRVSYQLAWKDVRTVRKAIGADAYDIHALRHSAASEIAAIPGMTGEHVRAITGHTAEAMVHLYAGAAMQKARAKEAQKDRK